MLLQRPHLVGVLLSLLFATAAAGGVRGAPEAVPDVPSNATANATAFALFVGAPSKVPGGAAVTLSFTPTFGKTKNLDDQGLILKGVLSNRGKAAITTSTCGKFNESTNLYQGDPRCVWGVFKWVIESDARMFLAAPTVDGPAVIFTNKSGTAVTYSAWTMDSPEGFYFMLMSRANVPITLTKIKVTGPDFTNLIAIPDIVMPAAVRAGS